MSNYILKFNKGKNKEVKVAFNAKDFSISIEESIKSTKKELINMSEVHALDKLKIGRTHSKVDMLIY